MEKLQSLLVGIDLHARDRSPNAGSEKPAALAAGARSLIRQAALFSAVTGARVKFLHSDFTSEEERPLPASDREQSLVEWRTLCAAEGLVDPEIVISQEPPWLAIIHRVLSGGYDSVMVAKHNESSSQDRAMGRVTMKLVRKCPVPVWVVQPDCERMDGPVLAATDLGTVGTRAVELASRWSQMQNKPLYVVHAWRVPLELEMSAERLGPDAVQARIDDEMGSIRDSLLELPCIAERGEQAHVLIFDGPPSDIIRQVQDQVQPSLTVLGSVGRGGIPGFLMGNTAERLIEHLHSSILVVKPEDFVCPVH